MSSHLLQFYAFVPFIVITSLCPIALKSHPAIKPREFEKNAASFQNAGCFENPPLQANPAIRHPDVI
jgi:hypothetical protein